MSIPKLKDLLKLIPTLERDELLQIKTTCNFFLGEDNGDEVTNSLDHNDEGLELCYDVIVRSLLARNIRASKRFDVLPNKLINNIRDGHSIIDDYIDSNFPGITKTKRMGVYSLIIDIIIVHLEDRDVPISLTTISQQLSIAPSLVDNQFPGYGSSGLMSVITNWGNRNAYPEAEED